MRIAITITVNSHLSKGKDESARLLQKRSCHVERSETSCGILPNSVVKPKRCPAILRRAQMTKNYCAYVSYQ